MVTELIGVKVEVETKDRILKLIEEGKYRNVSDFMHRAIKLLLDREESGVDPDAKITELEQELEEVIKSFRQRVADHEDRLRKLENR